MGLTLKLQNIRKQFGALAALDDVSLSITPGRVHGLLGENGAGKTTLMNILYGLLRADAGAIEMDGHAVKIHSPQDALTAGIGMVHQHFMLAGAMTVLDNVLLGDRRAGRWLDRTTAAARLIELSQHLGFPIDPAARISDLSVGQQQRVEILKAIYRNVQVLILDEPTAVLTPAEADQLFMAVNRLKDEGKSVVFISHKLREIKQICDDLTVLRRGKVVFQGEARSVSAEEISRHMVGRDIVPVTRGTGFQPVRTMQHSKEFANPNSSTHRRSQHGLEARATISTADKESLSPFNAPSSANQNILRLEALNSHPLIDVSLHIRPGEILGIAGVDGNGQQELAEAILGLRAVMAGKILVDDRDITPLSAAARSALGIAHIPNDRRREGLVPSMTITENLALKHRFSRLGFMRWITAGRVARKLIREFDIRTPSPHSPVSTLSGGNQQKVILARELAIVEPELVIAMNPARGLDVAATQFVYKQLLASRARGGAILLISSEIDELLALCDRIGVLYSGRFTMSDFPREGVAELGQMMTGAAPNKAGVT